MNNKKKEKKVENQEEKFNSKDNIKNKTFFSAMGHAVDGVIRAFKTERNLRIDYIIGLFVF